MSTADSAKSRLSLAIIFIFLGLPILMCGGLLSWWIGRRAIAAHQLADARAEIVARGLPIDDQSLSEFRYQRMSHEYSDRWMRVLDQLDSRSFTESAEGIPILGLPENEQPFVPGQPYQHHQDVRNFLAKWSELLNELHQITEGSGAIWTEIQFDSINTLLPRIQSTRQASRLLALEFDDAVRRDDCDQAFHSLVAMIGVFRSIEAEPLIISQLVHVALGATAMQQLKQAIELDLLNEEQLLKLLAQLKAMDDFGARYRIAIAGERAMTQPIFDDPNTLGQRPGVNALGARPIDALAALDMLGRAEAIETDDLSDFFAASRRLELQLQREMAGANALRRFDTALTGITTPAFGSYSKAVVRSAMELRMAKLAIGLRLYEKRHGNWPNTLDELNSDQLHVELGPISPIGPKPFGFRVTDGTAEAWGFHPEDAGDVTPEEPVDPLSEAIQYPHQGSWEYWHWKLPHGDELAGC